MGSASAFLCAVAMDLQNSLRNKFVWVMLLLVMTVLVCWCRPRCADRQCCTGWVMLLLAYADDDGAGVLVLPSPCRSSVLHRVGDATAVDDGAGVLVPPSPC
jgi:hypothetical protein